MNYLNWLFATLTDSPMGLCLVLIVFVIAVGVGLHIRNVKNPNTRSKRDYKREALEFDEMFLP